MYACFHSVGLPQLSILDVVEWSAGAGYAAIELNAETLPWAPPHVTPETSVETRRSIAESCNRLGMTTSAVGAHIGMVSSEVDARRKAIAYVNGCIDLAADLSVPVVHILSGPQASEGTRADNWRWFADAVEQTNDHASRRGVALGIEAIAGHLFHSVADYHRLIVDLPGVPFKINFDPSHLEVQGEEPRQVVDQLADRIVHVHVKDGKGRYPNFSFPPLGKGTIDFAALVEGLRRSGYAGALSVEYEAQVFGYHESQEEILDHGLAFLRRLGIEHRSRL
jgi:sugar phosphate isomerase/epimerase